MVNLLTTANTTSDPVSFTSGHAQPKRNQVPTIQKDILYKELYLKTFIKGNCETVKLFFQGNYS